MLFYIKGSKALCANHEIYLLIVILCDVTGKCQFQTHWELIWEGKLFVLDYFIIVSLSHSYLTLFYMLLINHVNGKLSTIIFNQIHYT